MDPGEEVEAMSRKRIIKVRIKIGDKEERFVAKNLGEAQYLLLNTIEKLVPGYVDEWLKRYKLLKEE